MTAEGGPDGGRTPGGEGCASARSSCGRSPARLARPLGRPRGGEPSTSPSCSPRTPTPSGSRSSPRSLEAARPSRRPHGAPREIIGVMSVRGRLVTVVKTCAAASCPRRAPARPANAHPPRRGQATSTASSSLVDEVLRVYRLAESEIETGARARGVQQAHIAGIRGRPEGALSSSCIDLKPILGRWSAKRGSMPQRQRLRPFQEPRRLRLVGADAHYAVSIHRVREIAFPLQLVALAEGAEGRDGRGRLPRRGHADRRTSARSLRPRGGASHAAHEIRIVVDIEGRFVALVVDAVTEVFGTEAQELRRSRVARQAVAACAGSWACTATLGTLHVRRSTRAASASSAEAPGHFRRAEVVVAPAGSVPAGALSDPRPARKSVTP